MFKRDNFKCVKCGSENCIGFILFHPAEIVDLEMVKKQQLKKYPQAEFEFIRSTDRNGNPDGCLTKFMELHVIVK